MANDPLVAALDALVAHIQTGVNVALASAVSAPAGTVHVMRGWPEGQSDKRTGKAVVACTAGPMTITRVPLTPVDDDATTASGIVTTPYVYAYWLASTTVTLLCDHRDLRDELGAIIHPILDSVLPYGPRGLRLDATDYYDRPVRFEITGSDASDDAATDMLGEWRQTWSLRTRSDLVTNTTFPELTEHNTSISFQVTDLNDEEGVVVTPDPDAPVTADWVLLELADAVETYTTGTDTLTQDVDGWITASLDTATSSDRFEPYDSQRPIQARFAMVDATGSSIDFYSGAYQAEVYIELDTDTLPGVTSDMSVWLGITDRTGEPSGSGDHRIGGVRLGATKRLYAAAPNVSSGNSVVLSGAKSWRGSSASWSTSFSVIALDAGVPNFTEAVSVTRAHGASAFWHLGVGTSTYKLLSGLDQTDPVRFRAWVRVYQPSDLPS